MTAADPNPRGDEPTKPLPAADVPTEAMTAPISGSADADPIVAPHVPVAEVSTAQISTLVPAEPPRRNAAKRIAVVGIVAAAAAVIAVLAIGGLQRGGVPAPADSTVPPAAPSPSTPQEEPAPVVEDPAPVEPAPVEPTPQPTAPTEPPSEPPTEPSPEPTA